MNIPVIWRIFCKNSFDGGRRHFINPWISRLTEECVINPTQIIGLSLEHYYPLAQSQFFFDRYRVLSVIYNVCGSSKVSRISRNSMPRNQTPNWVAKNWIFPTTKSSNVFSYPSSSTDVHLKPLSQARSEWLSKCSCQLLFAVEVKNRVQLKSNTYFLAFLRRILLFPAHVRVIQEQVEDPLNWIILKCGNTKTCLCVVCHRNA